MLYLIQFYQGINWEIRSNTFQWSSILIRFENHLFANYCHTFEQSPPFNRVSLSLDETDTIVLSAVSFDDYISFHWLLAPTKGHDLD